MAKFFENFTITLLYLAMAWLEFGGIWHAADKHSTNDTLVAIFVPPYAWYRSIEFFWHDDFANVDWEKRLVGDMETCVYILDYSVSEQLEPMKLNDGIELFLDRIANYPPEKIEYLQTGSKIYIEYSEALAIDLNDAFKSLAHSKNPQFSISSTTKYLADQLNEYGLYEKAEYNRNGLVTIFNSTAEKSKKITDKEKMNLSIELLDLGLENVNRELQLTYYKIFDKKIED